MTTTLVTAAAAVLCWPTGHAAQRLRRLTDPPAGRHLTWQGLTRHVPGPLVLTFVAALLALLLTGTGVAVAVAVGGVTARALWRTHHRVTERLSSAEAMADAVHGLVTELRAGAHPVTAAESAAHDAREPARTVLAAMAATARLGGDPAPSPHRITAHSPTLAPALRPLVHAWSLAHRHGLPLAEVLDAVGRDAAGRVRFARRIRARMAGPKASGTVLAALPVLGVALGEGMGAHPTEVLLTTPLGQFLLATGTTLICAGLYWITRLTTKAVLP